MVRHIFWVSASVEKRSWPSWVSAPDAQSGPAAAATVLVCGPAGLVKAARAFIRDRRLPMRVVQEYGIVAALQSAPGNLTPLHGSD